VTKVKGLARVRAKWKPESQGKEVIRVWAKKKLETKKSLGVTSHTPGSVRKREGI